MESYYDDQPSHIIYEGNNMIYIKNHNTSNSLSISKNDFQMNNIDFKTVKSLSDFIEIYVYGILGIIKLNNIPCIIYGSKYEVMAFVLDQCLYKLDDIYFLPLINYNKDIRPQLDEEFKYFKEKILKVNLYFSYPYNMTELYINQDSKKMDEINSYLFNYELIIPFLLNNNIKNKHDFFTKFISGYFQCFESSPILGQRFLIYYIFRKDTQFNYYECELIIRYDTDVYDYIYGMKIGNEKNDEDLFKQFKNKSGIIFDITNNVYIKHSLKNDYDDYDEDDDFLPYFDYIEYNKDNMKSDSIIEFLEEVNKEIKKLNYYYSCKDPLTGKSNSKYRQEESNQDGICIFIFDDFQGLTKFNKELSMFLVNNYFSNYQIKKDFKHQKDNYLNIKKIEKYDDFIFSLKSVSDDFNKCSKNITNISFKPFIYKTQLSNSNKTNNLNLKLFIGTYNVSAMKKEVINSKFNINYFLFSEKISKFISKNNLPDLYVLSFEEIVELNAGNVLISSNNELIELYKSKIVSELCKNESYDFLMEKNLVGILIFILIKSKYRDEIKNLNIIETKTGILGFGNKGNYMLKFKFKNKDFVFVTGHLSAGDEKNDFDKRTNELVNIFNKLTEDNKTMSNLLYFICGDLNFRIDLPKEKFYEICSFNDNKYYKKDAKEKTISENQAKKCLYELKKYDEMNLIKEKFSDYNLKEGSINFPPTYKYVKGSLIYDNKRTPSWTDRILYKGDKNVKCIFYDSVDLYISDHKPIIGLFQIGFN